ncbi:MAG: hypothetical protein Q4G64_07040, partial [bacterium]|nr:hypothetical protein [bacterium]
SERRPELIPWMVKEEHRLAYPVAMLRVEDRRRRGEIVRTTDLERLDAWKARLKDDGLVVHYDPDTAGGFWLVPKREGIDEDMIRVPDHPTSSTWE